MKKLIFIALTSLFIITISNAQVDTVKNKIPANALAEKLMLKSKKQNTSGWVFLLGGAALTGISFAVKDKESDDFSSSLNKTATKGLLLVGGAGFMIGSIPFFIVSGVNKRKAKVLLGTEQVLLTPHLKTSEWQVRTGIAINF